MEKKKKLSDSEIRLILLLVALLLLAGSYFLVYRKMTVSAAELETQNKTDQQTVANLENMAAMRSLVEEGTANMKQEIQTIIGRYPADLKTEKVIRILQDLENDSLIHISSVTFQMDNLVMDFTLTSQEVPTPPKGYFAAINVNYAAGYEGMKEMLAYTAAMEDRITAPTLSVTYDPALDAVSGTVTFYMYYLRDTGREYVPPVIYEMNKGVSNIFGGGNGGLLENNGVTQTEGTDETAPE